MKTTARRALSRIIACVAVLFGLQGISRGDDLWDIYQIALERDATYRADSDEYERAKLDLPLAKTAFRPTVTASGTGRDRVDDGDSANYESKLSAGWMFERSLLNSFSQTKARVNIAKIRFEYAQADLILRVAERYFQILAAMDNREVAHRQKLAIQRQMDLASKRLDVGLGTATDLFDAEARLQQSIADVILADNRIANAVQALKQITGATPEALATLNKDTPLHQPEPQSAEAWVAIALQNNRTLQIEDFELGIAAEEIKKQRSLRWPSLGLTIDRTWQESDTNSGMRTESNPNSGMRAESEYDSVMATLSWRLYAGGAIKLAAKQAALQFNVVEYSREALKREIEAETTSAYLAVISGISQVGALSEAIRAGTSALRAKEEGFRAGLTTNIDVLDAQRDLSRSRTDYLGARYDFILAVLRLERAAGDLDEDDVKRINTWLTRRQ